MKKAQQSTNIGILTILGGFLNAYYDVQIGDFLGTLDGLTFGAAYNILAPFVLGIWAIYHNEERK